MHSYNHACTHSYKGTHVHIYLQILDRHVSRFKNHHMRLTVDKYVTYLLIILFQCIYIITIGCTHMHTRHDRGARRVP